MQTTLTRDTLKGIWAGVTVPWDENYQLDEAPFRENLRRLVAARVHGIYIAGGTGEFYALEEEEEFERIVDILVEEVGASGVATQAGCNDLATHKVIRKLKYAQDAGVDGGQIALPFWMELTEKEVVGFFRDLSRAVPDLPLISYNTEHAKPLLSGEHFRRILAVAPNLIGVKWAVHADRLTEASLAMTPELVYFVHECFLPRMWHYGVRGSYSSLVMIVPQLSVELFELTEAGHLEEAEKVAQRLMAFETELENIAEELGLGMNDTVWDKAASVLTGFLAGHQRCRPPYIGWSDEGLQEARRRMREKFPDFMMAEP